MGSAAIHAGRSGLEGLCGDSPEVWGTWRPAGLIWSSESEGTLVSFVGDGMGRRRAEHTLGDMHGVSREPSSLPDQTILLRQQLRDLPTDQLVPDRLPAVLVLDVLVHHLPRSTSVAVVVGPPLALLLEPGLLRVESIAVVVLRRADGRVRGHGVRGEDAV